MPQTNNINDLILTGFFSVGDKAANVVPITGGTIDPTGQVMQKLNPAGAVTGIIIAPGVFDGQVAILVNVSAFLITPAAAGTSNVALGAALTIPTLTKQILVWDAAEARWF